MVQNLSPNQQLAISSLVMGATDSEAAKASGVTRNTIGRWKKLEYFDAALKEASFNLHVSQLEEYRLKKLQTGDEMQDIVGILLDKLKKWAVDIDFEKLGESSVVKLISEIRNLAIDGYSFKDDGLYIELLKEEYTDNVIGKLNDATK